TPYRPARHSGHGRVHSSRLTTTVANNARGSERVLMPHQLVEQKLQERFDRNVRKHYFRGMEFAGPAGDPGWFGPGSAVWHVHSHLEALVFGLQCAAYMERLDPSIYWMGMHHSRLVE